MKRIFYMKNTSKYLAASFVLALGLANIAHAETVVVVAAGSSVTSMTADEVSQVFLGKSNSMTAFDQTEGSPTKTEFYKKVTDKELAQVKAIWAKIVFTGKGTPPKEVGGNAEVKKAVSADPKAIGYIDKSSADASVKIVFSSH
jgi:ABC-type phosphate transport system substrate-binding protein